MNDPLNPTKPKGQPSGEPKQELRENDSLPSSSQIRRISVRVPKLLWFLLSWSMALSVPLAAAPSTASQTPDCPSWAAVSSWKASYTLTAASKTGLVGAQTVTVDYSSSGETHLTAGPQSCSGAALTWTSTLDQANANGSSHWKSVYPCPEGGTLTSSYSASGIGVGQLCDADGRCIKGRVDLRACGGLCYLHRHRHRLHCWPTSPCCPTT